MLAFEKALLMAVIFGVVVGCVVGLYQVACAIYAKYFGAQPLSPDDTINYFPRGDRVIVKRLPAPLPKEGELILPTSQQKPLNEGIVIAVGPGARNRITGEVDEIDLCEGDHVCFLDYAGSIINVDGVDYLSLRDEEIHGERV